MYSKTIIIIITGEDNSKKVCFSYGLNINIQHKVPDGVQSSIVWTSYVHKLTRPSSYRSCIFLIPNCLICASAKFMGREIIRVLHGIK